MDALWGALGDLGHDDLAFEGPEDDEAELGYGRMSVFWCCDSAGKGSSTVHIGVSRPLPDQPF